MLLDHHLCLKQITGYGVLKYHRRYRMKVKYYKDNPEAVKRRDASRVFINNKEVLKKNPMYSMFKPGRYKTIGDAVFETSGLNSVMEGHVYIITNPAWPEWVKIGMAVDANDRCSDFQTSSPFRDYKVEHSVVTNNKRAAEAEAHKLAAKIAKETRGEWFKLDIEQAKTILNNITIDLEKTG